jgi:hypothetical protein
MNELIVFAGFGFILVGLPVIFALWTTHHETI